MATGCVEGWVCSGRRGGERDERAAATRTAIREAAEVLFLRDGYTRTSMRAIADCAGVSEKTMYLHFATKATLLLQVVQVSVRGDEAPGPLADRPDWKALLSGPADEMLERFATRSARLMARSAPIIALAEAAADADPELAAYRDRVHEANRAEIDTLVAAFKRRAALARDITRECGWTDARYATFIARTLKATLGRP